MNRLASDELDATQGPSPSQRNAADIKRLKARAARRGLYSPGPGAYSPEKELWRKVTNSAAFRSSSAQTTSNLIKDQGDPGAYEPHIFLSLAKQASSSWNRRVTGACAAAFFALLTRTQSSSQC